MNQPHDPADVQPENAAAQSGPDESDQAALDPVAQLQADLASAQAQAAEARDQVLRAHAEMENVRRRAQEEISKARKFGIESFAESLVPG